MMSIVVVAPAVPAVKQNWIIPFLIEFYFERNIKSPVRPADFSLIQQISIPRILPESIETSDIWIFAVIIS